MCGVVDFTEKIRQCFNRVLGAPVVVGRVVTGRNAVHVLAVEFETVKSPIDKDLAHQFFVILHHPRVGGAKIVGIPP